MAEQKQEKREAKKHPQTPTPKTTETVAFIGQDGQKLNVLKTIEAGPLSILKKMGYSKEGSAEAKKAQTEPDEDEDPSATAGVALEEGERGARPRRAPKKGS